MRAKTKKRIARDRLSKAKKNTAIDANGSGARSTGLDYFVNMVARLGWGTPSITEGTSYILERLSNNYWLMLTLYRNHWLARRIIDLPAQDMTRAWPRIVSDMEPDDINTFDRTIRRTYTPRKIRSALKWARLYGGAGCLMAIKGHEKILDKPLDLDDVNPDSYLGLIPFDRWVGIYPVGSQMSHDLEHPLEWGLPEFYECQNNESGVSFKVHASRILRFCGPEVPTPELQAQMYWGISVLELIYEDMRKKDNASFSILNLMYRANVIARIDPTLDQFLSGIGAPGAAQQRLASVLQAQNEILSNQSMLVLGKDGDMRAIQYSFSGIGEVYAQFQMDVAGAAEMPVTKLFGRTITGLGQSNDADERYYEELIAQKQHEDVEPPLDKLYPVICMSDFGEVPDDLDFKFPSIRVLAEEEKGEVTEKCSAPILAAFNSNIISQKTALKEFKQLADVTGVFSNITDEDIDKAEDEVMQPDEMAMLEAGGGGSEKAPGAKRKPGPEDALRAESAGAMDVADALPRSLKYVKWRGMDVTIENEIGTVRQGEYRDGTPWVVTMTHDYGFLHGTTGADGQSVDCFVGPDAGAEFVYVIHTLKAPAFSDYDEDKCMLNFSNEPAARAAFFENYDSPLHFGSLDRIPVLEFIRKAKATLKNPGMIRN